MQINYKNGLIILSLLLILCLSLSAASATDADVIVSNIDEMSTISVDSINNENTDNLNEDISASSSSENKTFEDIQQMIDNAELGDEIELSGNYLGNGNQIVINKSLTIKGNGATINSNQLSRIFNVTAQNVKIINMDFINSKENYGGAIYWSGSDGYLSNCTFINCIASSGGAIYLEGFNSTVINCSFINCSAESINNSRYSPCPCYGGAIYLSNSAINSRLINSIFDECSVFGYGDSTNTYESYGGAIYWDSSNGVLQNCSFLNCKITTHSFFKKSFYVRGGAIYLTGDNNNITNNKFVGCNVKIYLTYNFTAPVYIEGGAIYLTGDNNIFTDNDFVECKSTNIVVSTQQGVANYKDYDLGHGCGGAIYSYGNNNLFSYCIFNNCSSSDEGGAIQLSGSYINLSNCDFNNCSVISKSYTNYSTVSTSGGAIYWDCSNSILENCNFNDCFVESKGFGQKSIDINSDGGAIYINYNSINCSVINCSFVKCSAIGNGQSTSDNVGCRGGAICWRASDGSLINCTFLNCSIKSYSASGYSYNYGGVIYYHKGNYFLDNCSFINCTINANLTSNEISGSGDVIYGFLCNVSANNIKVINCSEDFYVFYLSKEDEGNFSINNCSFSDCFVIDDCYGPKGGILCLFGNTSSLDNCQIINCYSYDSIISTNKIVITNSNFRNIGMYVDDILIINSDLSRVEFKNSNINITIINSTGRFNMDWNSVNCFINNSVLSNSILRSDNLTIIDSTGNFSVIGKSSICSIINCDLSGGSSIRNVDNIYIFNTTFNKISSTNDGTMYCMGNNCKIINCSFEKCSSSGNGGAIYCVGNNSEIINCSFVNCSSKDYAGAIYCEGNNYEVINCSFVNCSASYDSGAIFFYGDNNSVSNCSFVNCSAHTGGAIGLSGVLHSINSSLFNCSFVNCSSAYEGGAILWNCVNGSIMNCTFVNCFVVSSGDSLSGGGAIFCFGNNSSFIDCIFVNCNIFDESPSSRYAGGAFYSVASSYINRCDFINCSSIFGMGAIGCGSYSAIYNSNFVNCSATGNGGAIGCGSYSAIYNCSYLNCSATGNGTVIYCNGKNLSLTNNTFYLLSNNTKNLVYGVSEETLIMNNTLIQYNKLILLENITSPINKNIIITVKLSQKNINKGKIILYIDNEEISISNVVDSIATFNYYCNNLGNFKIKAFYYDDLYKISESSSNLLVINSSVSIKIEYLNNRNLSISLSGPINNQNIDLKFSNGVNVTVTTNSSGMARYYLPFEQGIYNVTASAVSEDYNISSSSLNNIEVGDMPIIVNQFGNYYSEKYIVVTLNAMSNGQKINLKFSNGVNVTVTTNSSGMARYYLPFKPGIYNVTAIIVSGIYANMSYNLNDIEIVDKSNKSFSDIQNLINHAKSGEVIEVSGYFNGMGKVINVNKTVVIRGINCATLDANNLSRIFSINSKKVIIENINLKNAFASSNSGGAISWFSDNGSVVNCTFVNCSAYDGGAIEWDGDNGSVVNCTFVNCSANGNGGAIYIESINCSINLCSFINCSAKYRGGAIECWSNYTTLNNSNFDNCFINFTYDGGAIKWWRNYGILNNCSFTNCYDEYVSTIGWSGNNGILSNNIFDNQNCFVITGTNVTVIKSNVTVSISQSGSYYKEKVLTIKLFNARGNTIANQKLNIKFSNGNSVTVTTNSKGVATYSVPYNAGTYTATVSGTNNAFNINSTSLSGIKIDKMPVTITPTALSTTYDSGKYFQVKVVDNKKKVVSGLKLTLKVYTGSSYKTVTVTTDKNGVAKYTTSTLSIGTHKVVVSLSNANYVASSKTSSIKVSKATTTVTAPVVKYKKGANKYFKVTVKNKATGKVVKSLAIKIKVYTGKKYKTYTVKTNANGIAQLNTRYLKKGTHKVVISSGNSKYTVSKSGYLIVIK